MSEHPPGREPNALVHETSPYLLQHAYNPVRWLPWGEGAFAEARARDVPVLLSVGYSACHWCHVMERESFEDERIAAFMNEHFVPVKVDREERPDVDSVYMAAVQAVSGQGGWPMTVFLTPDAQPFYAGTYYPPEDRYGRPGFRRLLAGLADAWTTRRAEVSDSASELTAHLSALDRLRPAAGAARPELADRALESLARAYDPSHGGFGQAPKFPHPGVLEFLLQNHARTGLPGVLEALTGTLAGMAAGGIYDQLGGGFARYSTDEQWLVPHFEKMLYDNAGLARAYLHAWQVTGNADFRRVAVETLDYVLREMSSPEGGFYAAQDADSEGVEGKFYVWTRAEVHEVLGENAALFCRAHSVSEAGNWEGVNVLTRHVPTETLAREFGLELLELEARLEAARRALFARREKRVKPGRDEKVIVSWNGLMLAAFAEAARVLDEPRYLSAARRNVEFVRRELYRDGRLLHTYKDGRARVHGMLDDYALYGLGLLELYRTGFERADLELALEFAARIVELFRDPGGVGFFDTPADGEALVVRPKSIFDPAMPSGNGAAAGLLQALGRLTGRPGWEAMAVEVLGPLAEAIARQPTGFGSFLQVLEGELAPRREVAVVGRLDSAPARAMLTELAKRYLPHVAVVAAGPGDPYLPVLEGRAPAPGHEVSAFVCENLACQLPVSTAEELAAQLSAQHEIPSPLVGARAARQAPSCEQEEG